VGALIFSACNKNNGAGITPRANSLTTLFAANVELATQDFLVDAVSGGSVTGAKGTFVTFQPNAFRDGNGNAVTGMVDVELVEVQSIGDMIWLNKQTGGMNGGQEEPLVSGGQIYLNASQNGDELNLVSGGSFVSMVDNTPDPAMELFSGTEDNAGNLVWDPFNTQPALQVDTFGYSFPNDSLGWINCDYFANWTGALTDVSITVPGGYDNTNTVVWVAFPSINSITSVNTFSNGVYMLSGGYQVPVGFDIVIVALHDTGNNTFESSFTPVTVTAGLNQTIIFQPTTLTQFQIDANNI